MQEYLTPLKPVAAVERRTSSSTRTAPRDASSTPYLAATAVSPAHTLGSGLLHPSPLPKRSCVGEPSDEAEREPSGGHTPDENRRRRQREKQVEFGRSTEGYVNMIRLVEHDPLLQSGGVLPLAPPTISRGSKRAWDIQLRKWRRALHMFDYVFIDDEDDESLRVECVEEQRKQWRSVAFTDTPKTERVRHRMEELLAARSSPLVPKKIPVGSELRGILRSQERYESVRSVVPQTASSITRGTDISPLAAGIKIHIAPSSALVRQQMEQVEHQRLLAEQTLAAAQGKPSELGGTETGGMHERSPSPKKPVTVTTASAPFSATSSATRQSHTVSGSRHTASQHKGGSTLGVAPLSQSAGGLSSSEAIVAPQRFATSASCLSRAAHSYSPSPAPHPTYSPPNGLHSRGPHEHYSASPSQTPSAPLLPPGAGPQLPRGALPFLAPSPPSTAGPGATYLAAAPLAAPPAFVYVPGPNGWPVCVPCHPAVLPISWPMVPLQSTAPPVAVPYPATLLYPPYAFGVDPQAMAAAFTASGRCAPSPVVQTSSASRPSTSPAATATQAGPKARRSVPVHQRFVPTLQSPVASEEKQWKATWCDTPAVVLGSASASSSVSSLSALDGTARAEPASLHRALFTSDLHEEERSRILQPERAA